MSLIAPFFGLVRHHNRSYSLKGKVLPTLVEGCFLVIDHASGWGFIYVWTMNYDNQLTMYKFLVITKVVETLKG